MSLCVQLQVQNSAQCVEIIGRQISTQHQPDIFLPLKMSPARVHSLRGGWPLVTAYDQKVAGQLTEGLQETLEFDSKCDFTLPTILLGLLLCSWTWVGYHFLLKSNILLLMFVQQQVAILEFSKEKMNTYPSTLPSSMSFLSMCPALSVCGLPNSLVYVGAFQSPCSFYVCLSPSSFFLLILLCLSSAWPACYSLPQVTVDSIFSFKCFV